MSIFDEMERDAPSFTRAPTEEELGQLTTLGRELAEIDERLAKWKVLAKQLEDRRRDIQMREMVDLLNLVGQDRVGLPLEGVDLVLEDYVKAGIPNPDPDDDDYEVRMELRRQGLEWLGQEAPDLISTVVACAMPKGHMEVAQRMSELLVAVFCSEDVDQESVDGVIEWARSRNEPPIDPARIGVEESVHWATLSSYVKEQAVRQKRTDLPLEALGATVGQIVKIKKRKAK